MQTGYYTASGAMVTQFNRLDLISNNLANLNTNGYKANDVIIGDFERVFKKSRDTLPLDNNTKEAAQFINRTLNKVPQIVETYTDFSLGNVKQTSNNLDFSLKQENTFFLVETPDGIRATRDGSFEINEDGHMVNKQGYPVLPKDYFVDNNLLVINPNYELKGDSDGNLYQNKQQVSSFYVAKFDNLQALEKEGNNLYILPDEEIPQREEKGTLKQGFVEKSNINAVTEMTALIETNRLVETYQKVMDTHMNQLNTDAVNKLASVRA